DLGDRSTFAPCDLDVQVDERDPEAPGQLGPDRRLPRAGHPHQVDDHGSASRYAARLRDVSASASPPNFSNVESASTHATTASPTTPPAGTAQTSVRCLIATAGSPVARSTVRKGFGTVEKGFIAARTRIGCPVDIPPSIPPARAVARVRRPPRHTI